MSDKQTALRECPFCGGEAEHHGSNKGDYIGCTVCGVGTTEHFRGSPIAVQLWNRRYDAAGREWVRIETVEDLPKEGGPYPVIPLYGQRRVVIDTFTTGHKACAADWLANYLAWMPIPPFTEAL